MNNNTPYPVPLTKRESWKDIPGFEGIYQVSDLGRIKSFYSTRGKSKVPKIKSEVVDRFGYAAVVLQHKGKIKRWRINRLVLSVFEKPMPPTVDACHNDGHRLNNQLANLRWGTRTENEADKIRHGTKPLGSKNGQSKLTETAITEIRLSAQQGASQQELGRRYQCSQSNISAIILRKSWKQI